MVAGQNRKMNYSTGSLNTNCGATKATPREFFETMNGLCLPRPIAQGIYYTPSTATEEAAADCTRTPVAPQRVMTSTSSPPMRSSFPSPVSFECTIHSLPDFNVSATPTLSPPTPVTDDFGLPLQPPLNSSGIDQNPDPSAQPAQLPQQQQYIDEKIIRSQFQAKHGEQIGIISPSPVTNNNVDLLQKNILRLEKLEKAIQYLVTYGLSCDELLEWLDDPRSYHEVYEQSLMKCVKAVYINSPNFGPWTGLKVLETIQKNGRYMSAGARDQIQAWYGLQLKGYNLSHWSKTSSSLNTANANVFSVSPDMQHYHQTFPCTTLQHYQQLMQYQIPPQQALH